MACEPRGQRQKAVAHPTWQSPRGDNSAVCPSEIAPKKYLSPLLRPAPIMASSRLAKGRTHEASKAERGAAPAGGFASPSSGRHGKDRRALRPVRLALRGGRACSPGRVRGLSEVRRTEALGLDRGVEDRRTSEVPAGVCEVAAAGARRAPFNGLPDWRSKSARHPFRVVRRGKSGRRNEKRDAKHTPERSRPRERKGLCVVEERFWASGARCLSPAA